MKTLMFTITVFPKNYKILFYFCSQFQIFQINRAKKNNMRINLNLPCNKTHESSFSQLIKTTLSQTKKYIRSLFPLKKAHKLFLLFFIKFFVKTHFIYLNKLN